MQSFLPAQKSTQQSVNFDLKKQNRETMSACITYTICDQKKKTKKKKRFDDAYFPHDT